MNPKSAGKIQVNTLKKNWVWDRNSDLLIAIFVQQPLLCQSNCEFCLIKNLSLKFTGLHN